MTYASTASRAQSLVARKGAAVTFTHTSPGTFDATTETWTSPSTSSVTGYAVQSDNDPTVFEALNLVVSDARTLFFTPTTYGQLPSLNDSVTWGGNVYAVKKIDQTAPDGTVIGAYVVVGA